MDKLFVIIALLLFAGVAFCVAFLPKVLPGLTNTYYSLIGMRTRVAEEDYAKRGVRLAGAIILFAEVAWVYLRWSKMRN